MSTDAAGSARQVAKSRPVKAAARIGLIAYGIVHLLVAWLIACRVMVKSENAAFASVTLRTPSSARTGRSSISRPGS